MATKDRRGGRRQRASATKASLGKINCVELSDLLVKLAPDVDESRRAIALQILVKGIELFREHAPSGRILKASVQSNRRALGKMKNAKAGAIVSFDSVVSHPKGFVYVAGKGGIVQVQDVPSSGETDQHAALDEAIATPLRTLGMIHQLMAGFSHLNPSVLLNPSTNPAADASVQSVADVLLDNLAHPRDWNAELAGYVFLAIARGLAIEVSRTWYAEAPPKTVRRGWNFGRLLQLAAGQAGAVLPVGRPDMERLMKKGIAFAEEMLEPRFSHPCGRTLCDFEIEFPEA